MAFLSNIDLHYKCGLVLFCSSVLGCLLPYQRKVDLTPLRPLSTGIIFGVAICHLLPDAEEVLDTAQVTKWFMETTGLQGSVGDDGLYDVLPVAEGLMCLGIFIMLVIDQCIPCPHHMVQKMSSPENSATDLTATTSNNGETARLLPKDVESNGNGYSNGISNGNGHSANGGCCGSHAAAIESVPKLPNAKVYATEVAIAIHSIIIGFTMGVNPNTSSLVGFTVAMVFHQLFEGIALAMIAKQASLSMRALIVLVAVFASSLPTGIAIGKYLYEMAVSSSSGDGSIPGDEGDAFSLFFEGVPNAISSGMLLHIGFELMMEDFNHHNKPETFPTTKLLLAFLGGSAIIFLAVWA